MFCVSTVQNELGIRLVTYFVNSRPYGTKPFDVTEDGEVEQLSVVKVTTWLHIPF